VKRFSCLSQSQPLSAHVIVPLSRWLGAQTTDSDCDWLKQLKRFTAGVFCFGWNNFPKKSFETVSFKFCFRFISLVQTVHFDHELCMRLTCHNRLHSICKHSLYLSMGAGADYGAWQRRPIWTLLMSATDSEQRMITGWPCIVYRSRTSIADIIKHVVACSPRSYQPRNYCRQAESVQHAERTR